MTPSLRRLANCLSILITLAFVAPLAPLAQAAPKPPADYDQFIVKFKDASPEHRNAALRQQRLEAAGHAQGLRVGQLRRLAVGADVVRTDRVLNANGIADFLARLRADPRVEYAEVDARVQAQFAPDDVYYPIQWNLQEAAAGINMPSAWDLADGSGQMVAVLDTGVTNYFDDLYGQVNLDSVDFISSIATAGDGDGRDWDVSDPGDWVATNQCVVNAASNSSWHGTRVAGVIVAATNNHFGIAGIAFGAKVMPVRVLGKCGGATSDIVDAIVWASGGHVESLGENPSPADVITLPLGGPGSCGAATQSAIDIAVANGSLVVASAGNFNTDMADTQPANCNNVFAVSAINRAGARASYSNFGAGVDIAAPGGDGAAGDQIMSTSDDGTTVPHQYHYEMSTGTSLAAAHVAGVAALVGDAANGTLEPAEIIQVIQATARPLPTPCPEGCGAGIVDAAAAVVMASQPLLTISDPVAEEGDSGTQVYTFTVSLSAPAVSDVTYYASVSNGTAHAGTDFVGASWPDQVIPAGSTSATYEVTVNGDTAPEIDETFSFVVGEVSGPVSVLEEIGTGTIVNDDGDAPDISISDVTMTEGNSGPTLFAFTVNLTTPSTSAVTFEIGTANGSAVAVSDYVAKAIAADSIAAGQTSKTVNVLVKGDTFVEGNEVFYVNLYNVSGAALVDDTGVGTITNDDGPLLSVGDAAITEGNSGTKVMTFTVSLSQAAASAVTYNIATANNTASSSSDYVASSLVGEAIPAGQLSKTFSVTLNGDTTVEANEILRANLSNGSVNITDAQGTGTILNDDGPTLSISDAGFVEGNSGSKALVFTVTLSQASASAVYYNLATGGGTATGAVDYSSTSAGGESIPAGQTSKTFSVNVTGDTTVEGNETFFLTLSDGTVSIADGQGKATITNDDGPVLSISDSALTEGNAGSTQMTFTVSLSQVAAAPVTFNFSTANGTASAGPDFVPVTYTGLKIPAGQLSKTVVVFIKGDVVVEPNETLVGNISLGNVSIKDGVGIGTITNDD